mgnify:CR=1 FL=1
MTNIVPPPKGVWGEREGIMEDHRKWERQQAEEAQRIFDMYLESAKTGKPLEWAKAPFGGEPPEHLDSYPVDDRERRGRGLNKEEAEGLEVVLEAEKRVAEAEAQRDELAVKLGEALARIAVLEKAVLEKELGEKDHD